MDWTILKMKSDCKCVDNRLPDVVNITVMFYLLLQNYSKSGSPPLVCCNSVPEHGSAC